jgi:hypothetical protein
MRTFISSGRRRAALALFVGIGSVALLGACVPMKDVPPPPSGGGGGSGCGESLSLTFVQGFGPGQPGSSPNSWDFGSVGVRPDWNLQFPDFYPSAAAWKVTNNCATESGTVSVSFENGDVGDFKKDAETDCDGAKIAPGGSCDLEVDFTPFSTGPKSADLVVTSDVAADGQAVAALTGTGT